ncbi:MAG TPA: RNA polymerase sigma factor [Thermoanaerobaculia bacterium]|nr:RNA polymerase sigma factor [Thermoanaerobaculia bacterium]
MTAALLLASEPISDAEVVRRVLDGDTAVFEILMRRYNQRVYRAVRAVLRDDAEVEDVMQQAYLNAYSHLGQFAERAQFSTWLIRIAVNEALARVRKRGRLELDGGEDVIAFAASDVPDPEQQALTAQMRAVVEAQVEALPMVYRTVLVLRDVEGLSTAEAASCLGVSEDVVKTRLHRARAMVRDGLTRRAGVTVESIYEFGNSRCDRVVAAVMARL